jgi:hypothetical protein
MPQKIKGNIGEAGRVLILDESDFNTIEVNEVIGAGGAFDIEVPSSGIKLVIARSASGETIGYGMTSTIYEAPAFQDYTMDFIVPAQDYACGEQYTNLITRYNTDTGRIGTSTGTHYNPWFWVPNVTIAQGATINSAILKTEARNVNAAMTGKAQINLEDNATPPYSSSQWGGKIRSEATNWSITPATTGTVYNWAEMASHLQQVVNRTGWSSGNAVLLLFEEATYTRTINYHATGWGALHQGYAYPTLTVSWREYP